MRGHRHAARLCGFRRLRSERAQALVEFVLVLPIFLILVLATIDFGWALRGYITATNAAREGARLGITGATAADITARTVDFSSGVLSGGDVTVSGAKGPSGTNVTVQVHYDYHYISPVGGLLHFFSFGALPDPLPISATTTMRLE